MKQKDIALIVLVAGFSAIISFVISTHIFVTPANRHQKVGVVDSISTSFSQPSTKYFNGNSVDPAQEVPIGGNNANPFSGGQ